MTDNPRWDAYEAQCHHQGLTPSQEGFEEAVMELGYEFIRWRLREQPAPEWTPYFLERIGPYIAEQAACRAEAAKDAQEDR